jgi:hypothetical protein
MKVIINGEYAKEMAKELIQAGEPFSLITNGKSTHCIPYNAGKDWLVAAERGTCAFEHLQDDPEIRARIIKAIEAGE